MSAAGLRLRDGQGVPLTAGPAFDAILTGAQVAAWLKVRPRQLGVLGVPHLDWGHKTKRYSAKDVQGWLDEQPRVRR